MKTILIFKNQKCTLSFKLGNKGFSLLDNFWGGGGVGGEPLQDLIMIGYLQ